MGTGGYTIQTCTNPMSGDNGVLQNSGRLEGCEEAYSAADCSLDECPWLLHSEEYPDDGSVPGNPPIWEDFECISTLGTGGCGFEQQLESSFAAVTYQSADGMANEGFLREDSILAVVYVTDEDDCSAANAEMYNPSRDDYGPLNVRCALNPEELHPISRYVEALEGLRPGAEELIVVAVIAGIPIDGTWNPGDSVDRLRDLVQVNPSNPNELLKSCDTTTALPIRQRGSWSSHMPLGQRHPAIDLRS